MCFIRCWNDKILGLRYDDSVSQWLRTYFGTEDEFDLVVFDDEKFQGRQTKNGDVPNVARDGDMAVYHDMSALHLCSLESVADLNTRLEKKIEVYNFRPNIIVTDVSKPFEEVSLTLQMRLKYNGQGYTSLRIFGEKLKSMVSN